jgi:hypothetical protein
MSLNFLKEKHLRLKFKGGAYQVDNQTLEYILQISIHNITIPEKLRKFHKISTLWSTWLVNMGYFQNLTPSLKNTFAVSAYVIPFCLFFSYISEIFAKTFKK